MRKELLMEQEGKRVPDTANSHLRQSTYHNTLSDESIPQHASNCKKAKAIVCNSHFSNFSIMDNA